MENKTSEQMIQEFRERADYTLKRTLKSNFDKNKRFFSITQHHFNFYTVIYKSSIIQRELTFAEINTDKVDNYKEINTVKETDGDLSIDSFNARSLLSYFIHQNYLKVNINQDKIVTNSIATVAFKSTQLFADFWIQADLKSIDQNLGLKQFELVKFNENILNRSTFEFEQMIDNVDDPQFTNILNQILGAYNTGWFYVSASAIGGLIEMLLYKTAVNYGKDDFETQRDKITKKNYVKKMRELRNFTSSFDEKQKIHFDALDELTMDRDYLTRNAVSHYTTGFVNEREVESLFVALSNTYIRYFLPSKHYNQSRH